MRAALMACALVVLAAVVLLAMRGGLIGLIFLIVGGAYLVKSWRNPSTNDIWISLGLALGFVLTWFGTWYYVIFTYESGEVVELTVETEQSARSVRLWVMDIDEVPVVYYDAEPVVAESLLEGKPLQFTRGDQTSTRIPEAKLADDVNEAEANRILSAMTEKYAHRMTAVDVYYVMLGRPWDRVALIARLPM